MACLIEEHRDNPALQDLAEFHVENVVGENTRHWSDHHLTKSCHRQVQTFFSPSSSLQLLALHLDPAVNINCRIHQLPELQF